MSDGSTIEWTDATWNPVRGCVKVSPGCKHCYAETFAERWRGVPGHPYGQGFDLRLVPEKLEDPIGWRKSRRIFVNSMSDLFQEGVPTPFVERVFDTMARAPWHFYQLLTKRADRMRDLVGSLPRRLVGLPHVWLGVSVENRKYGLPRIEDLRRTPATVRFLSIEPLLEDLGPLDLAGIHWVIVGGESGPGARPMRAEWVRSIRRQCREQRVPFFFKQWGGVQKGKAGRLLDGRTYDELPRTAPLPAAPARVRRGRGARLAVLQPAAKGQQGARAEAKQRKSETRTGQLHLLEPSSTDTDYFVNLIDRYRAKARTAMEEEIDAHESGVSYERLVDVALSWPLTSEREVKDWLGDLRHEGRIELLGLGPRARVPRLDAGHVVKRRR